jgi:non-ribosomal peptide synthetase component E (peptide arylation enzyme)
VIIRGGENISATELENVLEAHPDVSQACVVGYPDDVMGERVCAFVVAPSTFDVDACRVWFNERGVARYKTPEQVVPLESLPLLATGKPDRTQLRAAAAARFHMRR